MLNFAGKTLAAQFARARVLVANFRNDRRANVAVITAIAVIPIFAAIGCVVDYTMASTVKTRLQAAADATSLAVISVNSSVLAAAKAKAGSGEVSGDSTFINNFFTSNLANLTNYQSLSLTTASVVKSGQVVTATVAYTAQVPTYFMGIFGHKTVTVSGTSQSTYTLPTFLDVYLMLDVSGSMGFPSTSGEQTRLMAINPDLYGQYAGGCTFACHFSGSGTCKDVVVGSTHETTGTCGCADYGQRTDNQQWIQAQVTQIAPTGQTTGDQCQSYNLTRTAGNSANSPVTFCQTAGTSACIQLRLDAVGYAVTNLLTTAARWEQVANQFRVGLFPFIVNLPTANPASSCPNFATSPPCPLTTSLPTSIPANPPTGSLAWAAQQLPSLLDTGNSSSPLGSGGTNFANAFSSITTLIKNTGIGTGGGPTNTLPYVFLITDGVNNSQVYNSPPGGSGFTGSNPTLPSTSACTTLKNLGVTIAILYIPYQPIPATTPYTASWATSEDNAVNAIIPSDPGNLQSCASPNFFYTASTPADINNALTTMFEQAASTAHISQ
jgi:Flp pilus assembly protein TadG